MDEVTKIKIDAEKEKRANYLASVKSKEVICNIRPLANHLGLTVRYEFNRETLQEVLIVSNFKSEVRINVTLDSIYLIRKEFIKYTFMEYCPELINGPLYKELSSSWIKNKEEW